ncbi:hypothetical protein J8273_0011 [Carpediemonas membranifera]|uniref:Uncharacterized protein n=1 Tax=Carpediemonas membranifera TaxID=201153 RepID=A0A8J6AUY2_9EUKA|nr:hypothetical protein J8273_0011 [Carpediemonas membranifera]|eukprot:KAG9394813.1 hypothetical protein J8273_0011 [Carpediemonas membranifera]
MNVEQLSAFLAPYLTSTKPKAWYSFREAFIAHYARNAASKPLIFDYVAATVLKIMFLECPDLEDLITRAREVTQQPRAAPRDPLLFLAPPESDTDDDTESDTDSSVSDESEHLPVHTPETPNDFNKRFISMVNDIFGPLDRQDALDRFDSITFDTASKNVYESMLYYTLIYQRTLENCASVPPKQSSLVAKFLKGIRNDRLRERCKTFEDKSSIANTMRAALSQAKKMQQAEKESHKSRKKDVNDRSYAHDFLAATVEDVNHRSVPRSAEHSLTCPFLREGLGSERHDQIRDTLAKLLRGHPWRVRVEHWLGRGSEWTVDRTKRVKARADLLLTRPGHTEPVVLDVVVSNHASASMRSKKEQYANWNVRVIPVVVRQSGGVGAVHGRGWTDEMRDVLGLDAETVGQIADAVMMACMRQQVHVFHAFMRQADAAHRQAEANGLNH